MSFILLRQNQPNIERPYRSPLGILGAVLTIIIGIVTQIYQVQDANFTRGVLWVAIWFAVAVIYFGLVGRHKLILSPEEEFALEHKAKSRRPGPVNQRPGCLAAVPPSCEMKAKRNGAE